MAHVNEESSPNPGISFVDFPEDVQLAILSFLSPSEISSFCLTSKRFACYTRNDSKLWHSLCDRRWGSKTQISSWSHNGKIPFRLLYRTLDRLDNLIGFWRRIDRFGKPHFVTADTNPPSLLFFEWGPSYIQGSEIRLQNRHGVGKKPFLWMGLSKQGQPVNYLHPPLTIPGSSMRNEEMGVLKIESWEDFDLVSVDVSFVGSNHLVIEENQGFVRRSSIGGEEMENSPPKSVTGSSPPDRVTSDLYQYFANRTSPGWERAYRRHRRKERQRQGRRLWEPEHYVKIVNASPTPARPLQGLWKGLDNNQDLCFYIVAYDDIGGITCRRAGEPSGHLSGNTPVFWTANTTFIEPPFSSEERSLYDSCWPERSSCGLYREKKGEVSRILRINSSYDLVIPCFADSLLGSSVTTDGRIWQYRDGTFAFGFLRDHFTTDLRQVTLNGRLLDAE
ncbi:hypothetical protein AAC387_Pa02g3159 [Persea americana]